MAFQMIFLVSLTDKDNENGLKHEKVVCRINKSRLFENMHANPMRLIHEALLPFDSQRYADFGSTYQCNFFARSTKIDERHVHKVSAKANRHRFLFQRIMRAERNDLT